MYVCDIYIYYRTILYILYIYISLPVLGFPGLHWGKDDLVQSCRREWPTGTCPDALSAIKIVTEFAFSRYNRGRVPSDQMRAPTDSEIQSYLDSLKESWVCPQTLKSRVTQRALNNLESSKENKRFVCVTGKSSSSPEGSGPIILMNLFLFLGWWLVIYGMVFMTGSKQ